MYQLSHLLSEQRSLLNSLSYTSILGDENSIAVEVDTNKENGEVAVEEAKRNKLAEISENVEGCGVI